MAFDLLSFLLGKSTGSGGGGGSAALGPKTIRQNGVYRAASDNLDGYNTVTVEVSNTYAAADNGKVVSDGALVVQTSRTITENGTFDTTLNNEVVVNIAGNTFTGDDFYARIMSTEKLEINTAFSIQYGYFFSYLHAPVICLWGATGADGQYAAQYCFRNNTYIQKFVAPKLTRMCRDMFTGCTSLSIIDLNNPQFDATSLSGAPAFNVLILRGNSVPTLNNISAFGTTPFAADGTGGTLYVQSALISSYQSATNWSTILGYANNQILPIEGSIYENAYADGTPIAA